MVAAPKGRCYWLTGYSGAGKSTVARMLRDRLRKSDRPVLLLDGDVLRSIFGDRFAHDRANRLHLAMSYGRLCREITDQGIDSICATISMFHEVRRWNRENISDYVEIYLRVPLEELERRDPKGLYREARSGIRRDVVGIDLPGEEPENPDLIIDNCGDISPERAVELIWNTFQS